MKARRMATGTVLVAMALAAFAPTVAASPVWIAVDHGVGLRAQAPEAAVGPTLAVAASDATGLDLTITLPGVLLEPRELKIGEFASVTWPDAARYGQVGAPELPVVRKLFVAPPGATVSVSAVQGASFVIDSATAGLRVRPIPVQPPVEKLPGAARNAAISFDEAAYTAAGAKPVERATVQELGIARGQRLFLLEVRPVAFDAAAEALIVWPTIDVSIRFKGGGGFQAAADTLPGLDRIVLNPEAVFLSQTGSGNYLIVVAPAFESGIVPFANAKAAQGYNVTTWTATTPSTTQIKNQIASLYADPQTRPAYILLVGDTNTIPHWTGGGDGYPATDLPYTCMDGASDWFPDIAIGRFPVRTTAQLADVIDKTLDFENAIFADPEYLSRAVFMASNDNYTVSEGTHNWCIANYMEPNLIVSDKLYCHTYNATTQQVRDAFNDGRIYGIYSGHGSETSWADGPPFSQTDVRNLFNDRLYSFVCSFACVTGTYTLTECFTETWLLEPNKGAAGIWGSSVNSYWTEDDVLQRQLFSVLYDDYVRELGPCFNATRVRYAAAMGTGSTTRRYFEMYNLMGDPSLYIPDAEAALRVTPSSDFEPAGDRGGPFTPSDTTYHISNVSDAPFTYSVTHDASVTWITLSGDLSGTLGPSEVADITVTVNEQAGYLTDGGYVDAITFTNLTDHVGDTTRAVNLTVGVPHLIYEYTLDTDPKWSTEGQWAFGTPTGGGSSCGDPTSGHTGSYVYGYNLAGDYSNNMPLYALRTQPIYCVDLYDVELRFWRWLGVESSNYDSASVQVSNDMTNWTTLWDHNSGSFCDGGWQQVVLDISDVADNQQKVYVRWTMGPTDYSVTYPGWNIDDVEIWAVMPPTEPCDLDGDGDVDLSDFTVFSQCFSGSNTPPAQTCPPGVIADFDQDGDVDVADFVIFTQDFTGSR